MKSSVDSLKPGYGRTHIKLALVMSILSVGISLSFAVSTFIGVIHSYTGLPYWDSWDGYLNDVYLAEQGDISKWWAQHNEHRILLARLLFWVDLHLFGGNEIFLLVMINLVTLLSAAISVIALTHIQKQTNKSLRPALAIILFSAIALTGSTLWMQNENLTWGFQIQFVFATTLPLATFVLIGLSAWLRQSNRIKESFWSLCLAAFSASGAVLSMSAGLATPWLALVGLIALSAPWRVTASWTFGSLLITTAYLEGYSTPPGQVSVLQTLKSQPLEIGWFFLRYLGSPAYHVSGSTWLATLAGAVALVLTSVLAVKSFRQRQTIPSAFTLGLFAIYILMVAFITAAGRVPFGMAASFAYRYSTPAIMLWIVLAALLWVKIRGVFMNYPVRVNSIVLVLLLIPAGSQVGVLSNTTQHVANRNLAGIAISLEIPDDKAVNFLYPDATRPLLLAKIYRDLGLTPLGRPPYSSLSANLGNQVPPKSVVPCQSKMKLENLTFDHQYQRVTGILEIQHSLAVPSIAKLLDENDRIMGYVSIGTSDIFGLPPLTPISEGDLIFSGYLLTASTGPVRISGNGWSCSQPSGF